jgi:diguanylate cyclase (GGDEF)-like protein
VQDRPRSIVRRARRLAATVVALALLAGAALMFVYQRSANELRATWVEATAVSAQLIRTAGELRAWEAEVATRFDDVQAAAVSARDLDPIELASYRVVLDRRAGRTEEHLAELRRVAPPDLAPIADDMAATWQDARALVASFTGEPETLEAALGQVQEVALSLESLSGRTIALYEGRLQRGDEIRTRTMWTLIAVFMIVAGYVAVAVHRLASRISAGISELSEGTERLTANELEHRIEPPADRELAELAARFNLMAERLGQVQGRLADQARSDDLTGLPNRRALLATLEQHLALGEPQERAVVGLIDLDGFKEINDSFGHPVGDEVLIVVARRLRDSVGDRDVVARLGGDEFGLVLHGGDEQVDDRLRRVLAEVAAPIRLAGGAEVAVEVSAGLVRLTPETDAHELLRNADVAMYRVKDSDSRRCWFEPHMQAEVLERTRMQRALARAVEDDQFLLHFQPIVDTATARVCSVECLVRWEHPELGVIAPDRFVPLAEATGLIQPLGDLILVKALESLQHLDADGTCDRAISINLSPRQLTNPQFVQRVRSALESTGVAPERVVLEVTESVWLEDIEHAVVMLEELRELGVRLSLDDFGTGYSSLSYLGRLPAQVVKLDRALVQPVLTDARAAALVAAVVQFSEVAGLTVVAEGVETRDHQRALATLGCDVHQGYLYARPVPLEALPATIARVERIERGLLASSR